jgi:DNA polymerase-3 subunit alpha
MSDGPFVHLHCHSHYSLLDGAAKVEDLVEQAKALGMNALALTDHGNLYGAIEFYQCCQNAGIKPILGYEAYVAPAHRTDRQTRGGNRGEASFHLTLLAQNRVGFENLIQLATHASLEGFYYRPRIDKELLEAHSDGLIVLSGCASSEMSSLILSDRFEDATRLAQWFARHFGRRFCIEVQDNGLDIQRECGRGALEIANRLGIPAVATCDAHYLCSKDAFAHEVLLCINTGRTIRDPDRMRYGSDQFYLKSPAEMYAAFPAHSDAVRRSQEIADEIDIVLDFKRRHFPVFHPPPGKTDQEYLRDLCAEGLAQRPDADERTEYRKRLDHELSVINKLGFASYFLIVWDFVRFAREQGIPCGARGSACGALVSYLLGFSNVDPLAHDLLFERFLDPSRAEAPDIDIDFCQKRRDEVIEYVRTKYGEKNVAQIITFGTMAARAAIRDVGRALEIPLPRVDRIAKMVPAGPNMTLERAMDLSPDLRREYENDAEVRQLIEIAGRLEGLARNASTHAAGVVVADQELTRYVPLQKNGDIITTQWEMNILEKIGMLKVDFLGLRNLTLLTDAVAMIRKVRDIEVDLSSIPLDDPATYELLQRGETKGVFQLESEGIRNLLVRLKPDRFQDIIATNALYRPGPLGGGMVDKYINVKHRKERAEYAHPVLKEILEETYGIMVYQEQVMRILNRLGGIDLADAYKCIKAISKKNMETIARYRTQFIAGARKQGLDANKAEQIFGLIEYFAGYGFNKSHSTAYALVAYQTAYLKAHYPAEFLAALLSSEVDKTDQLADHIDDCRRLGIRVLPPDINTGEASFLVVDGVIRFGLTAIKGVGDKAIESIIAERQANGPFSSIFDFCERIDPRVINRATVENLIKAGAMDSLRARRAQMMAALPTALSAGAKIRMDREQGQGFLFEGDAQAGDSKEHWNLPEIPEWSDREKLAHEKALLGVYLSSHPLAECDETIRIFRTHMIGELDEKLARSEVVLGGMISGLRTLTQQKGRSANQRYARFAFEDLSASVACIMFADAFAKYGQQLANNQIGFLRGTVDSSRDATSVIASEWIPLEEAPRRLAGALVLRLDANATSPDCFESLSELLRARPGKSPVFLEIWGDDGLRVRMRAGDEFCVACDAQLARQVEALIGEGRVTIAPASRNGTSANGAANGLRKTAVSR